MTASYCYTIVKTARTDQEAIRKVEGEIQPGEEVIGVEACEEANTKIGILSGLIGSRKQVKRKVTVLKSQAQCAKVFLEQVLAMMEIDASLGIEETPSSIQINVSGQDMGTIIGKRGKTIDEIQYLTRLVSTRNRKERKDIEVDVEDYRKKREESLRKLAFIVADKVLKTRNRVEMEPMNGEKRRIIHCVLQDHPGVITHSVGEEFCNRRRVVVDLRG